MENSQEKEFKFRCYKFTLNIMKLIEFFPNRKMYWSLSDQLFRSASSIGANVVEAKSASSKKDHINFFQIALKSANETKYWLALARDSKTGNTNLAIELLNEVQELSNILAASVITMKKNLREDI